MAATSNEIRASACARPDRIRIRRELRSKDRAGHIRLKIEIIGICATDYPRVQQPYLSYPRTIGLELPARVMENNNDDRIARDHFVAINPYVTCHACSIGKPNCCESIEVLGVHRDGSMCEESVIPEARCESLGDAVTDQPKWSENRGSVVEALTHV